MSGGHHRRLVGRGPQAAALDEELSRTRRGEFRCVLIHGSPGIGKTRLATDLVRRHGTRATGLVARGHALGAGSAFGLWAEAIDGYLWGRSADEVRQLCGGLVDDLAGLARAAAAVHGSRPVAVPAIQVVQGLVTVLDNLGRERPVIVLLDDAHLADGSSWEALTYLADNLVHTPVLVLAVLRLDELAEPSAGWRAVVSLEQAGQLHRLEVPPLTRTALSELAARALGRSKPPTALVDWLDEQSRGNPLFAVTLLDAVLEQGVDPTTPRLQDTPSTLVAWVELRLNTVDDLAREVAETLAVADRAIDLSDLQALVPDEHTEESVLQLVDVGLVHARNDPPGAGYEIAHPLVRDALYTRMGAARRRALHRRLGRAMRFTRPDESVLHLVRAAAPGDEEAIRAAVDALRQTWARGTIAEAFELLRACDAVIPSGDRAWLDVLDALALDATWTTVYNRISVDFDAGIQAFREINRTLDQVDDPDPSDRAGVQLRLAGLLGWGRGDTDEAAALLKGAGDAFAEVGRLDWSLVALNELSWMHALGARYQDQEHTARQTLETAHDVGDPTAELLACGSLANLEYVRGRFDQARSILQHSIDLARAVHDDGRLAYGLAVLALVLALEGRLQDGRRLADQAVSLRPATADPLPLAVRTQLAVLAGDLTTVRELGTRVLANFGGVMRAFPAIWLAMAAVEAGDLPLAQRHLRTSNDILRRRVWMLREEHERVSALVAWAGDGPAAAVAALRSAVELLLDDGALPYAALLLVDLAEAALDVKDAATARWASEQAARIAESVKRDHHRGLAALTHACAALADDDLDAAAAAAQAAVDHFEGSGYQLLEASSLLLLGRATARSSPRDAVASLRAAAETLDECGARWRRDRVLRLLDELGKPGHRAAAAVRGPAALTARESEIALLAAQGLTARQIGEELHIGTRTVETHLAHAYAKLGVRNRVELARAMARTASS